jgi:hypothetical protein
MKIRNCLVLAATLVICACGNESKKDINNDTSIVTKTDTANDAKSKIDEIKPLTPNDITVKLFFKGWDSRDEETGEVIDKGEIGEHKSFRKEKKYTFCYDSEDYNKLEIEGNGKGISILVTDRGQIIFNKKDFEIKEKIVFTTKDFNMIMGSEIVITIKQDETVLFKGKIDSQQCM